MKYSLKEIKKETNSIRDQKLTPVTAIRFGSPTPSPKDLKKKLGEILKDVQPSLVAIDHKEISAIPQSYSIDEYMSLIKTACEVCHTHGIKCTNGGLEDNALILYYLDSLKNNTVKLEKVLGALNAKQKELATQSKYKKERTSSIAIVKKLLDIYSDGPLDYINVTWSGYPELLFGDIVRLIKKETGKNVVSTEMEIPEDKKLRDRFLKYVRSMRLECVIWYFPFENLKRSHLVDEDENLTDIANSLRNINRSVF